MDREGAVIISCNTLTPEDIICKILRVKSLPASVESNCAVKGYPWSFKNKYYSSTINLYALKEKAELNSNFCDSIKAVIFYYDSEKKSSFDDVASWLPYLKDINAEVQLLVCNNCFEENCNPALEKRNILKWCVENQYELVELNPIMPDSDDEALKKKSILKWCVENQLELVELNPIMPDSFEDEPIKVEKGYGRVVEALQSYTWANLVMEENASASVKEQTEENSATSSKVGCKIVKVEDQELDLEEKWLNDVLKGNDPGGESFEALFSKFASMKDRASGLNGDERKKYAEKVAIAFWRAMGGAEDEIEGLDDTDK